MKNANLLLIHKFLSGEITEVEQIEFSRWLAIDSKNRKNFEVFKLIWDLIDFEEDLIDFEEDPIDYDPEEVLLEIQNRINAAKKG